MKSKSKLLPLCTGLLIVGLCFVLQFASLRKSETYFQAFKNNTFLLEGDLAFVNTDGIEWYNHIVEFHSGSDYGIKYSTKSYYMIDGQYYVEDTNRRVLVSTANNKIHQIEEMFARASVLSNYNFSNFTFRSKSSEKILDLSTGKPILCDCEEYEHIETGCIVRMYFVSNRLYAIQAKENPHFLFYVSKFSKHSPPIA